jgi:hypothetical protein
MSFSSEFGGRRRGGRLSAEEGKGSGGVEGGRGVDEGDGCYDDVNGGDGEGKGKVDYFLVKVQKVPNGTKLLGF